MHVLTHVSALCHGCDHRLAKVLRVRAREADSLDSRHRVAGSQQLAELRSHCRGEIAAPRVHVLAEERDLSNSCRSEVADLSEDVARSSTLLAASDGRDDAVRALGVAAHRHLHPRLETPLPVKREIRGEVVVRTELPTLDGVTAGRDPVAEVRDRAGPERDVDEGVLLEDPLALRLRVTATHGNDDLGSVPLHRARVAEVRGEARVRLLANRAGVEDDDVRLVLRRRLAEPQGLEHALDPLGVVSVHLAPEGRDVVAPHGRPKRSPYPCVAQCGTAIASVPTRDAHTSRCSITRPSSSKRSSDTPGMVSISPERVVIAPHHSTAARSPSTTGSPNRHSADA